MFKFFFIFFIFFSFNSSYSFNILNINDGKDGECSGDGYKYENIFNEPRRELCKDKDLPKELNEGDSSVKTFDTLSNIGLTGFSELARAYKYLIQSMKISNNDDSAVAEVDISTKIVNFLGSVYNSVIPNDEISQNIISLSINYGTNQYCQYQSFFIEERDIITRQLSSPGGGYAVYPVYPMQVDIKNGQCDYNSAIEKTFEELNDFYLLPKDTKCSYSYSATRDQCVSDLAIPLFSSFLAADAVAEVVCMAVGSLKGGISKTRKIVTMTAKVISLATKAGLELFADPKFAFDPVTLNAFNMVEASIDFVFSSLVGLASANIAGVACMAAKLIAITSTYAAAKITISVVSNRSYDDAKKSIKNVRFCGHGWLSYEETRDGKYYSKGPFKYSRYRAVNDCITKPSDSNSECNMIQDNEKICEADGIGSSFCNGINKRVRDVRNKIYREFLYSGEEYESTIVEENIQESDNRFKAIKYNIDYCIDPRLPEQKGYSSIFQRYYMKGNDKANFACGRFFYDGKSGCVLPENLVDSADTNLIQKIHNNGKLYYLIRESDLSNLNSNKDGKNLFDKYSVFCKDVFIDANKCCKYRSQHMFCLENKGMEKTKDSSSFCFSNVIVEYMEDENSDLNLLSYLKNRNTDSSKVTCEVKKSGNSNGNFSFEGTKKKNTNFVCVYSDNVCPYNFKLNAGLNYRSTYCDSNYFVDGDKYNNFKRTKTDANAATCREGLFSAKMRKNYKDTFIQSGSGFASFIFDKVSRDLYDKNYNVGDFERIYDFNRLLADGEVVPEGNDNYVKTPYSRYEIEIARKYGFDVYKNSTNPESSDGIILPYSIDPIYLNQIKTSAYGQVKNFCQYRAHCVEVEKEEDRNLSDGILSTFLDSSCNGKSVNSRNVDRTIDGSFLRQLSVPVVECIYESLKNLITGTSGMSSCVEGDLNSYGFCGSDTEEDVEKHLKNNNMAFFEGRYNKTEGWYRRGDYIEGDYIIKGLKLPEKFNPFLKIQNFFYDIIRIALTVFLVLFGYRFIMSGEFGIIKNDKGGLIILIVKFVIVSFLVFNNGWQRGIYNHIVNFSVSGYNFVNNIFTKIVNNPKNIVLNFDNNSVIKVVKVYDELSYKEENEKEDMIMCYKYDIFNNISFRVRSNNGGCGGERFVSKFTSEIRVKYNTKFPKQEEQYLIISENQEIEQLLYYIDKYNEINIDKLRLEIKDNNGNWSSDLSSNSFYNRDYDGCYFDPTEYKAGKEYISFFDIFDCKMLNYLGYTTSSLFPNLLMYSLIMLVPQYFFPNSKLLTKIVSGFGSILFGLMLTFMFFMFNILIKAVYTFVSSFFTLSILIFLSPVILPLMFFNKTKKIFDNWHDNIWGLVFRPMFNLSILILYINIMDIMLLDRVNFIQHNNAGRSPLIECPDNYFSFFCILNTSMLDVFGLLERIFNGGLESFATAIIMAIIFFFMADSFIDTLEVIIGKIFNIGSDSSNTASMGGGFSDKSISNSKQLKKSFSYGKKTESFRKEYVQGAGHAVGKLGKDFARGSVDFSSNLKSDALKMNQDSIERRIKKEEKNLSKNEKLLKENSDKVNSIINNKKNKDGNIGRNDLLSNDGIRNDSDYIKNRDKLLNDNVLLVNKISKIKNDLEKLRKNKEIISEKIRDNEVNRARKLAEIEAFSFRSALSRIGHKISEKRSKSNNKDNSNNSLEKKDIDSSNIETPLPSRADLFNGGDEIYNKILEMNDKIKNNKLIIERLEKLKKDASQSEKIKFDNKIARIEKDNSRYDRIIKEKEKRLKDFIEKKAKNSPKNNNKSGNSLNGHRESSKKNGKLAKNKNSD